MAEIPLERQAGLSYIAGTLQQQARSVNPGSRGLRLLTLVAAPLRLHAPLGGGPPAQLGLNASRGQSYPARGGFCGRLLVVGRRSPGARALSCGGPHGPRVPFP